ncbi:hypothetical protein [Mycolicibacterium thermoresistibile]|uniref:Uncharacterized protein n=1 Tax=Mycolicibacterium thermoresistibile (strain ATCC 19527 / DSM 44167 / CIP 105390 / JCM 6362 / NCTC 10409 / 316) TaxID=1078020 RepID=G7CEM3_MYCT3|nr:hypothetical protein [Mycolicibacterium thermoresistibile]EHI13565.1 hypothetical protein KEK_07197 [Mycolicibacterium thermoresistibile ATCC 19527]MCV7189252.1 hypothetical protein [Mycolicibacterium thermoresistibile]SNW17690.1 Uncharacterised protein [Mycolicibacterium thermoresistibile]
MSNWLTRLIRLMDAVLDPRVAPYHREPLDCDRRRVDNELNAIRSRFRRAHDR